MVYHRRTHRFLALLPLVLTVALTGIGTSWAVAGAQDDKVTVTMWLETASDAEGENCFVVQAVDPFNAESTTVEIETANQANVYDATRTALAGGGGPDIVGTPGPAAGVELARADVLLPLDEYAAQAGWTTNLAPWAISLGTVDGKLYNLPSEVETLVLYYNKTLFAEHGWQPPATLDELMTLSATLDEAGIIPFAHTNADFRRANEFYTGELLNHGPGPQTFYDALTGKIRWDDPVFVQAIDLLNQMQQNGWFMGGLDRYYTTPEVEANAAFGAGEAAMVITGTWFLSDIYDYFGEEAGNSNDWDWVPMPSTTGEAIFDLGLGSTFSINKNSEHPAEAAAFLSYLFTPEVQARLLTECHFAPAPVPLTAEVLAGIDPREVRIRESLTAAFQSGSYGYTTWTFWPPATDTYHAETIEQVWAGDMTVEEYLAGVQASFEEEVAKGAIPPIPTR